MANHKSAIKRHKQSLKRRDHNRGRRSEVRTAIKAALAAAAEGKSTEALALAKQAESKISSAGKRYLYHPANARRKISRLISAVNAKASAKQA